ncbi:unnamed protein product [Arabis nemorensis]|uniref:Uncharacterized protein n=1 Tax=Arabis nemorensis TaxID=586526 RepID=A0A565CI10_9BRAS|nr:unnamed protein product [Arabis nemorensis]
MELSPDKSAAVSAICYFRFGLSLFAVLVSVLTTTGSGGPLGIGKPPPKLCFALAKSTYIAGPFTAASKKSKKIKEEREIPVWDYLHFRFDAMMRFGLCLYLLVNALL